MRKRSPSRCPWWTSKRKYPSKLAGFPAAQFVARESGRFAGAYVGGLHSLFILEKGKPVVRPGRKAVDHDRPIKRRGSLVTEGMTVCHARAASVHGDVHRARLRRA